MHRRSLLNSVQSEFKMSATDLYVNLYNIKQGDMSITKSKWFSHVKYVDKHSRGSVYFHQELDNSRIQRCILYSGNEACFRLLNQSVSTLPGA
ncbi:hypothetical protein BCV73_26280 [Paenibacillus sp. SSG-1]|nr:hypothetical protein BCV73_26280 [Paenibacillus sp. SSG-1]